VIKRSTGVVLPELVRHLRVPIELCHHPFALRALLESLANRGTPALAEGKPDRDQAERLAADHWRLASQPGAIGRCPSIEDDPRVQSVLSAGSRRATRRPAESLHVIEVAGMTAARVALACGALTSGHGAAAVVGGERERPSLPIIGRPLVGTPKAPVVFDH